MEDNSMAYCSNCGSQLPEGTKYCPNCGQAIESAKESLTPEHFVLRREKAAAACLAKVKVIVDGKEYPELKNGEEETINLFPGTHSLFLQCGANPALDTSFNIYQDEALVYPFKIGGTGAPVYTGNSTLLKERSKMDVKKKRGKGCLTAIICIAFLLCIISILGSKISDDTPSESTSSTPQATNSSEIQPQNTSPEPVKESKPEPVTETVGDWEITINDFSYVQSVSTGLVTEYRAAEGSKYCIVDITAKNIGKEADTFLPYFTFGDDNTVKLVWKEYEYTRSILTWAKDDLCSETMNPLVTASGKIAFEVPDELVNSNEPPVLVITEDGTRFECKLIKSQNPDFISALPTI